MAEQLLDGEADVPKTGGLQHPVQMPFATAHDPSTRVASRSDAQHRGFAKAIRGANGAGVFHRSNSIRECLPISSIIVADQIPRRRVPRECRHDLLRQQLRRRMCGYREPQQSSSIERGERLISAWNERAKPSTCP